MGTEAQGTEANAPVQNPEKPKAPKATKPKAEKPKATKPKVEKEKCVRTAYDPKNRQVHLHQKGDKYRVLKGSTGFTSGWVNKKRAAQIFDEQQASSHNQ